MNPADPSVTFETFATTANAAKITAEDRDAVEVPEDSDNLDALWRSAGRLAGFASALGGAVRHAGVVFFLTVLNGYGFAFFETPGRPPRI